MKKTPSKLDKFLTSTPKRSPYHTCRTCQNTALVADLTHFLDARAAEETHRTFHDFYHNYLAVTYPSAPKLVSVRKHVIECMRRDVVSGRPLGE